MDSGNPHFYRLDPRCSQNVYTTSQKEVLQIAYFTYPLLILRFCLTSTGSSSISYYFFFSNNQEFGAKKADLKVDNMTNAVVPNGLWQADMAKNV